MKGNKGITLVSLVLYVCVMIVALSIMSIITTEFYANTEGVQEDVQEIVEFNKFNNYFLKEVKNRNNKVEDIKENYILFATGNSFRINNDSIYFNNIKVCNKVKNMNITLGKNSDGVDKTIINVTLEFESFKKSISYKIENVY